MGIVEALAVGTGCGCDTVASRTSNTVVSAATGGRVGLKLRRGSVRAAAGCGGGVSEARSRTDFRVGNCGIIVRGGWTGATGRGGMSAREGIGGGGFAVRGWPNASR